MTFVGLDIFLWESYLSIPYAQAVLLMSVLGFSLLQLRSVRNKLWRGRSWGETNTAWNKNKNRWGLEKISQSHGLNNAYSQKLLNFVKIFLTTDKHVHIYMCVCIYTHICRYIFLYMCMCVCVCMHLSKTVVSDRLKFLLSSVFHFLIQLLTCSCPCLSVCWSFPV